jgi:hypothetical protein
VLAPGKGIANIEIGGGNSKKYSKLIRNAQKALKC